MYVPFEKVNETANVFDQHTMTILNDGNDKQNMFTETTVFL